MTKHIRTMASSIIQGGSNPSVMRQVTITVAAEQAVLDGPAAEGATSPSGCRICVLRPKTSSQNRRGGRRGHVKQLGESTVGGWRGKATEPLPHFDLSQSGLQRYSGGCR
jgi:hypothetical protein